MSQSTPSGTTPSGTQPHRHVDSHGHHAGTETVHPSAHMLGDVTVVPVSDEPVAGDTAQLAPDAGRPFARARVARFGIGFAAFGLLWIIGLMIVAAVLLPQRLRDIGVGSPRRPPRPHHGIT